MNEEKALVRRSLLKYLEREQFCSQQGANKLKTNHPLPGTASSAYTYLGGEEKTAENETSIYQRVQTCFPIPRVQLHHLKAACLCQDKNTYIKYMDAMHTFHKKKQVYTVRRMSICFDLELPHEFLMTAVKQQSLDRNQQRNSSTLLIAGQENPFPIRLYQNCSQLHARRNANFTQRCIHRLFLSAYGFPLPSPKRREEGTAQSVLSSLLLLVEMMQSSDIAVLSFRISLEKCLNLLFSFPYRETAKSKVQKKTLSYYAPQIDYSFQFKCKGTKIPKCFYMHTLR